MFREGVKSVQVPKGLLLHDPLRWRLFLVPAGTPEEKLARWLRENGLAADSPVPPEWPRTRQLFWVTPDYAPSKDLQILGSARFACVACGESCRAMRLGPLSPEDVARLLALDWSGSGRDPSQFFVDDEDNPVDVRDWAGSCELFLRRENRACQFLRKDNLCDVHARYGAPAKPTMCRAFPYFFRATPGGTTVGMRIGECLSAPRTSTLTPVVEQREELQGLLAQQFEIGLVPPSVWFSPRSLRPYEEYEALEQTWLAAPPQPQGFAAMLFRALAPEVQPGPPEELQAFLERAREDALRPLRVVSGASVQPLDAEALAFEDRALRQHLFNKDLFQAGTLAMGAAALVLKVHLARLESPEGTAAALNRAMAKWPGRPLGDLCQGLDVNGLAARILAA